MIQKIPDDLDFSNGSRFLKTKNLFFAEYHQSESGVPRHIFVTRHTIIFVEEGKKIFHLPEGNVEISAGGALLLPKGCYMMCEGVALNEKYSSLSLFFDEALLKNFWKNHQMLLSENLLSKQNENQILSIEVDSLMTQFKNTILGYFEFEGSQFETLIRHKLEELILLLLQTKNKSVVSRFFYEIYSSPRPSIEFIMSENLFKSLSVPDLARLSNRSLSLFKKEFQQIYDCPPHQWIVNQRLERANVLLKSSALTIAEIAYACGFENASHFAKVFKQKYGSSPNSFKN